MVLVDDDVATLSVLEKMLAAYRVSAARDGDEALAILSTRDSVDLLITDYMMPGMTGEELVARARMLRPHLRVLVVTGHASALAEAEPIWWAAERHLIKPVELGALQNAVKGLIGSAV